MSSTPLFEQQSSTEIAVTEENAQNLALAAVNRPASSLADVKDIASIFVASGFFADVKKVSEAIVKILAGQELGFGPFASMRGLYIIKGKVGVEANLIAQGVKRGGKYNYRVRELTDTKCRIEFFEHGSPVGFSEFTAADAKRASTQNMDKFPRNMLFARALSNGAKWYAPDAFGAAVYTPEELRESEDGETVTAEQPHIATPRRKSEAPPEDVYTDAEIVEMEEKAKK